MTDHNILCTSHDIKYSYAEGGVAPARAKVKMSKVSVKNMTSFAAHMIRSICIQHMKTVMLMAYE